MKFKTTRLYVLLLIERCRTVFVTIALLMIATTSGASGDTRTTPPDQRQEPSSFTTVSIDKLDWLSGSWRGQLPNGATMEHTIAKPRFGQMLGMVRFYKDSIWLNELTLLTEHQGAIKYIVRHFDTQLIAEEPVDQPKSHTLLDVIDGDLYFEGIEFKRLTKDSFVARYRNVDDNNQTTWLEITMTKFNHWQ